MNKNYWFKRKRYGYGFVPVTLKGWALTLALILGIFIPTYLYSKNTANELTLWYNIILVAIIIVFIIIIHQVSPKPKWRWGKKEEDNPEEDF